MMMSGQIRSRNEAPSGGFAASAVNVTEAPASAQLASADAFASSSAGGGGAVANLPNSDQIMQRFLANQQLQQHYMLQQAAAAAAAAAALGGGGGAGALGGDYASQLAAYVGSAEVWCSKHGRRLQMRTTRSLDGGMTFVCIDPTECLAAPLENPKVLAMKGCSDLWCSKHRRMRAPGWLIVEPTAGKGFVCKKPHLCRQNPEGDEMPAGLDFD